MFDRLASYLLYGNLFCGIEHTTDDSGDLLYVSLLQKQKKTVDVTHAFKATSFVELSDELKKNQHAALIINTENILTKRIASSTKESVELVFNAFPNIKLDDFYFEINKQGSYSFVSICRKDYVDALLSKYSEQNIIIGEFYLGNLVVSSINEFINDNPIYTSNASIQKSGAIIDEITLEVCPDQKEYDINGLQTNNRFLLSLCGAFNQVLKTYDPITNAAEKKEALTHKLKQVQFFNVLLKLSLGIIFISLLINFFLFNHYFNNVKELQALSLFNNKTNQKIITLKKDVDSIQKLANDMLKINTSKSSFYINIIGQNLPSSILLSELNYQPLLKGIKDNEPIINDPNAILINGGSSDSHTFSTWVSELEKKSWIHKVEILDYNDVTASSSNFSIKLLLKP